MPIYEFFSPTTGKIYSFFARSTSFSDKTPTCPDGKKNEMKKILSSFSITGTLDNTSDEESSSFNNENPFDQLEPKQAELAMRELEGSMQGIDEDNPDPKQMGSLMRRMCEITGEKMDGQMEEVVRKLEEGMDPDVLEDQFADFTDNESDPENNINEISQEDIRSKVKKMLHQKLFRDPELYEFSDYLN